MLLASLALTLASLAPGLQDGGPPILPPGAPDDLYQKPYRVGYPVFEPVTFVTLADEPRDVLKAAEKKPVVLVFWSLRDKTGHDYRERLEILADDFLGRANIHLIAAHHDEIGSRAPDPWKSIKGFVEKEQPQIEILVDKQNKIADDFRALCANHVFIIDAEGYLKYSGGIDNDPKSQYKPETRDEYVRVALDELFERKDLTRPLSRPHGRVLKRHPDSPPRTNEVGSAPKPKPPGAGGK